MNEEVSANERYKLNSPQSVSAEFEDRTAIVNVESGDYFSIWGEKVRAVFHALIAGASADEICEAFGIYSFVSVEEMRLDLEHFVQKLLKLEIITRDKSEFKDFNPPETLLYDRLKLEEYPTFSDQGIPWITCKNLQKAHSDDKNQSISQENSFHLLEQVFREIIDFDINQFSFQSYQVGEIAFRVGYESRELHDFFHPVISTSISPETPSSPFNLFVKEVAEEVYDALRSFLDPTDQEDGDVFKRIHNEIEFTLHRTQSDALRKLVYWWDGTIRFYNQYTNTGYYLCKQVSEVPKWEKSFSFRELLNWHIVGTPYQMVHGAGISWNGKGVLLTAAGGSGKSTTTFSCIMQGMKTLGDDFVLMNTASQTLHHIYSIAKLRPHAMEMFSGGGRDLSQGSAYYEHNQKYHISLAAHFPEALVKETSLDFIMIPRIKHLKEPRFVRAGENEVLASILLSTLYLLPGNKQAVSDKVKAIVRKTPCYYFDLSSDLELNPKRLKEFIAEN